MPKKEAGKKDDFSNVPASVLAQQEAAEAKIKLLQSGDPEPTPEKDGNTDPIIDNIDHNPAPKTPEPAPAPAPDVDPVISDGTTDNGKWEHKYNVLQGKYNSEIQNFKSTIVDLRAELERQAKVIEGLNSKQTASTIPTNVDIEDLNPEDFQGWGDEMQMMVSQVNKLKAIIRDQDAKMQNMSSRPSDSSDKDNGLNTRIESLESEIHDNRIASYLKYLDENVKGDWKAINKSASFNKWVKEVDPISLQPRLSALSLAAENLRGAQVASIFNLYLSSNKVTAGITIADELPGGGGDGGFDNKGSEPSKLTAGDVKKAQEDFIKGRISEEEYDKISNKFQKTLRG